MPRNSKLTPEVHRKLVELMRRGCARSVAIKVCLISDDTYYRWLKRGKALHDRGVRASDPYRMFYEDIEKATAQFESSLVQVVTASAFGIDRDGKPTLVPSTGDAKWLLERRFPKRWQPRQEITRGGPAEVVEFVMNIPAPRHAQSVTSDAVKARLLLGGELEPDGDAEPDDAARDSTAGNDPPPRNTNNNSTTVDADIIPNDDTQNDTTTTTDTDTDTDTTHTTNDTNNDVVIPFTVGLTQSSE